MLITVLIWLKNILCHCFHEVMSRVMKLLFLDFLVFVLLFYVQGYLKQTTLITFPNGDYNRPTMTTIRRGNINIWVV